MVKNRTAVALLILLIAQQVQIYFLQKNVYRQAETIGIAMTAIKSLAGDSIKNSDSISALSDGLQKLALSTDNFSATTANAFESFAKAIKREQP